MAANINKILSGGVPSSLIKGVTAAKTDFAVIAAPADAADLALIFTAGDNGGFIDSIVMQIATDNTNATQTATIMNIWLTASDGTNARVIKSVAIAGQAATSTTVPGFWLETPVNYWNIETGCKVFVSFTVLVTHIVFNVTALGGQFTAQ